MLIHINECMNNIQVNQSLHFVWFQVFKLNLLFDLAWSEEAHAPTGCPNKMLEHFGR